MTFPLYIFLFPYLIFLIIWAVFSLTAVYHMLRFGFKNITTILTTIIYIGVSAWLLYTSYQYIDQIDWDSQVSLFKGIFEMPTQFFK